MSLVNLSCPHCNGLLEIDERLAGHQIACPTCQNVVTIPSWADLNPGYAPPPPMDQYGYGSAPPSFAPPPPTNYGPPMDYAPPPPMGAPDSSSMQLSCPHCAGAFTVTAEMQGQEAHCPTCGGVVSIPMFGGYTEPTAPAYEPPPFSPQQQFAPQPQFAPQQPQFVPQQQPYVPPQPYVPEPQYAPQQPASAPVTPKSPNRPVPISPQGGAPTPNRPISTNSPIPLSSTQQTASTPTSVSQRSSADAPVMIPTAEGRQVAVSAPVKTVKRGRQEIELRKLTPEEKAVRRRNMNLMVMAFCMIFLSIIFFVLLRK